ncbi:MAG: hypothetical protein R2810_02965 [Flavobacteriales bacterium]
MAIGWHGARAAHFSGASITYECLGGNQYQVSLDLFVDCSGVAVIPQDLVFQSDCGDLFTVFDIPVSPPTEVSQLCPAELPNSTCNGGALPGIEHYVFQTTVNLAACDDWTISWSVCCRNTTVNLVANPAMYVEASLSSATAPCNNSPSFTDQSLPYVCVNQEVNYNFGVTEPDGNTLVYSLINARYAAPLPTPCTYTAGYTGGNPVPGIMLDPVNGQITFTPTITGNYVVVVLVEEYDAMGNLIGTVMRDLMFTVLNCTGSAPTYGGLSNNTAGVVTGPGAIQVCDGEPFCVDLVFTDPDAGTVLNVVSQATTLLPGATFSVNGTNPAVATLCWTGDLASSPVNVLVLALDGACPIQNVTSTAINITVLAAGAPVNAGTDGALAVCSVDAPVALFGSLGGGPDAGGSWTGPGGTAHSGTFDPTTDPAGSYAYVVGVGCASDTGFVDVSISTPPDAGTDAVLSLCSDASPAALIGELGGTPLPGGAWTDPNGVPHSGTFDPATDPVGAYTYTVNATAPCVAAQAQVTVSLTQAPDAGLDASVALCSSGAALGMLAQLNGTPDAGGSWTDPNGNAHSGTFDPGTDQAGAYTYSVAGTAPCGNAQAVLTVTVSPSPDAGGDASISFCDNGPAVPLLGSLAGTPDPGGSWVDPNGNAHGGTFDPASDPAGVYVYTVNGVAPCANSTAQLTIALQQAPDAGQDATLDLCTTSPVSPLFPALGGTPAAGGIWTDPNGNAHGGAFDPATDPVGAYTYTVAGTAPCVGASATVTVSLATAPDAGQNTVSSVCSNAPSFSLLPLLNGTPDAGGSWTDPNGLPFAGPFDPAVDAAGTYTYTVAGISPCVDASATLDLSIVPAGNAGLDASLALCDGAPPTALFTALGGTPDAGGTWTDPNGNAHSGTFDPTSDPVGVYTYQIAGTAPCADAQAALTVSVDAAPDAGSDAAVSFCANAGPQGLLALLGGSPDGGGSWTDPNGNAHSGTFDPLVDPVGVYEYLVPGSGACPDATAELTVSLVTPPDAGSDAVLDLCSDGAATALFGALGGSPDAGGTWTDPNGNAHGGTFDPASDPAGNYSYVVAGGLNCADAQATITVNVSPAVNAGLDGVLAVCDDAAPTGLFAQLNGTPDAGGSWTDPNGNAHGGSFDAASDPVGIYTYTVVGTAPCPNAQATVTVSVAAAVNAGQDGSVTVCDDSAPLPLFAQLGGTPDAGGTWTDPNGNAHGGSFDPATDPVGAYTYLVAALAPCSPDQATVTVSLEPAPNAGLDGALTLCENSPATGLFAELGGTPNAGGSWTDPNGNAHSGTFDPASDPAGVYTYTLAAQAPCPGDQSTVTVSVNAAPDAGVDGATTVCDVGGPVGLFASLGGTPDAGGSWTDANNNAFSGTYDPAVDAPGVYTYTITGTAPCADASATVTVSETTAADAGTDGTLTLCANSPATGLFAELGGTPDAGGSWADPNGNAHSGTFNPASDPAGVYTYTLAAQAPCPGDQSTVTVSVNAAPDAGLDGATTVCDVGGPVGLFASLGGTPDAGGSWTDANNNAFSGTYDPAVNAPGVYTYTVTGAAPCASATATVTVSETTAADAGTDGTLTLCANSPATGLFAELGGTPDAGGSWTDPNGNAHSGSFDPASDPVGVYTYTLAAQAPCPGDQSTVTVSVNAAPDAGVDGATTVCDVGGPVGLFASLGGTPDVGGSWTDANNNAFSGTYDPAVDAPGVYTYTITGTHPARMQGTVTRHCGSPRRRDGERDHAAMRW